jgi:hypothetical protein
MSPQVAELLLGMFADGSSDSLTSELPVYVDPVDAVLAKLLGHPCIVLILGHRGSGKTALAARLQELLRDIASPYAVGLPAKASRLLPDWYGLADDTSTIPSNALIYIPESYRMYHARDTQSAQGKALSELVNLSRHRRHTLIFDVQNPAHLDRNIVSEADLVLVKEPGPLQQGFERPQYRNLMDTARAAFAAVGPRRKKRAVWVVAPAAGVNGQLMDNLLPSFWSDSLSRIFGDTPAFGTAKSGDSLSSQGETAVPRRGKRTPPVLRKERAKAMHNAGHTYGEIAKNLGISKSQAYRDVNS